MNKYFILCHIICVATEDTDCEDSWSYLTNWSKTEDYGWENGYENEGDLERPGDVAEDLIDGGFKEWGFPYLFDNLKEAKEAVVRMKIDDNEVKTHNKFKYYIIETAVKVIPDCLKKVIKA